ncbi:MAG: dTMP kinase [Minisyncoccales bacterium]
MKKNPYPGKFIVFEGLDGSGQSTQASLLSEFLIKQNFETILTKEPTVDSSAGQKIKEILDEKISIAPDQLQILFTEDRREHLDKVITPSLKADKQVICDRYFFSTFAYGTAEGLNLDWLIEINDEFLLPDLTFLLKVSPEICLQRIKKRGMGIKLFEKKEKLIKVWQVYESLLPRFDNIYLIDGEKSINEVFEEIKKIVVSQIIKK